MIYKFYQWLSTGGYKRCAEMSPMISRGSLIFAIFCLLAAAGSKGWDGLGWVLLLVFVYPVILIFGAMVQLLGLSGKHEKKRIALYSLIVNISVPLVFLGALAIIEIVPGFLHQIFISILKMIAES